MIEREEGRETLRFRAFEAQSSYKVRGFFLRFKETLFTFIHLFAGFLKLNFPFFFVCFPISLLEFLSFKAIFFCYLDWNQPSHSTRN